jgi:branched-chain amino acid transport system permease protein
MLKMIIINGLLLGGTYALLAAGFALVFGVARIMNMAHTAFYMITAFLIYVFASLTILPTLLSIVISVIIIGILGMVCYRVLFDRVKEHHTPVMIIGVALALVSQEVLLLIFSGHHRGIKPFFPGFLTIAGVSITYQLLLALGVSVAMLVCVWFLLTKTRLGLAIRCASQDMEIANVVGVNVARIAMITVGVSAVLAGTAAAVLAPLFMIYPLMWMNLLIITLAAVVLGGLGSIKGAVIAAFMLGFAESAVVFLVPQGSFLRGAMSMAIMIAVLVVKPEGLFGVVFEEEVL